VGVEMQRKAGGHGVASRLWSGKKIWTFGLFLAEPPRPAPTRGGGSASALPCLVASGSVARAHAIPSALRAAAMDCRNESGNDKAGHGGRAGCLNRSVKHGAQVIPGVHVSAGAGEAPAPSSWPDAIRPSMPLALRQVARVAEWTPDRVRGDGSGAGGEGARMTPVVICPCAVSPEVSPPRPWAAFHRCRARGESPR